MRILLKTKPAQRGFQEVFATFATVLDVFVERGQSRACPDYAERRKRRMKSN
jgi:hypothetical protein